MEAIRNKKLVIFWTSKRPRQMSHAKVQCFRLVLNN